jgi:hypothetical protein
MKHPHVTRGVNYEKKAADFLDKYSTQIAVETFIPLEPTEPDDLIVDLDCKILLSGSSDGEDDIEAGHIKAYRVHLALAGEHYSHSPRDIMDAHSQEVAEYIELLDDDGNLREDLRDQFDVFGSDLLILHKAEIKPEYRGSGLGLLAVRRVIETFAPAGGLVAYKPFPFQFTGFENPSWVPPAGVTDPEKALEDGRRKLAAYWARLGSRPVEGTEFWALSTSVRRPTIQQLLRGQREERRDGAANDARKSPQDTT